jgi:hypothetical protein
LSGNHQKVLNLYAKSLHIYGFKCFGKAELALQYPGRKTGSVSETENINLILGDNGGGKSSVLRALAIAVLASALLESGFVPYRLVRRPKPGSEPVTHALLKVAAVPEKEELKPNFSARKNLEMLARIETRPSGSLDRLHLESTPASPIADVIDDDLSPAFFVAGYGATRRVETADFSSGSERRRRGLRYQRIAGLFEDHVALRPLQNWLPKLRSKNPKLHDEAIAKIDGILPDSIRFRGAFDEKEEQYLFEFEGAPMPFSSLSDGYKAFVGWVGDLVGHLTDVAGVQKKIDEVKGIVLVDEIDLHLHPAWQRTVVPTLEKAFPSLQFVLTSHSPLIASSVRKENVFVTDTAEDGTSTIKQLEEKVYGRSAEDLLLSSYFGLQTTRPDAFVDESKVLFNRAAEGDSAAALTFLEKLAGPPPKAARGRK